MNSVAHYAGSRQYNDNIKPTNKWLVSIASGGEGWHNYHHCFPSDYTCAEQNAFFEYNPSKIIIDLFALFGQVYDRKITKTKDTAISTAIMKQLLPLINTTDSNKSYKLIINDHRALRVWLLETEDKIEGFSKVYKHKLLEVSGSFDDFMVDLVESSELQMRFLSKAICICNLYSMDRITVTDTVKPFRSNLPKHSIERDKEAVAYHYDTSNKFFELILSENMLYTSGLFCDSRLGNLCDSDLNQACINKVVYAISIMDVKEGQKVLDVGCGWGVSFMSVVESQIMLKGLLYQTNK